MTGKLADATPRAAGGDEPERDPAGRRRAGWLRRLYLTLRTEHTTPGRVAAGTALGVFVGCSPLWGLHTAIALLLARGWLRKGVRPSNAESTTTAGGA